MKDFSAENTHAVMLHHFHNENHPASQGSLSKNEFSLMLDWLLERYQILTPNEYLEKLIRNRLKKKDICLTFDDALLCQSEIAVPILKSRNLQAFFFIYSSPFLHMPDYLEIYRYFRTTCFCSIDDFYSIFFQTTKEQIGNEYNIAEKGYNEMDYLKPHSFYTPADKWFRYLRDQILGKKRYEMIMKILMQKHEFEPQKIMSKLWMTNAHLKALESEGHQIGLHSFSHPTTLHLLDFETQRQEYTMNFEHLLEVLDSPPISMSHPCGNYSKDTLDTLRKLGIRIGFRSNNSVRSILSPLEVPREDHAIVLQKMKQMRYAL